MIIDISRRFTDKEWKEKEKYFSLYFAMVENDRTHAECWDRENTPHDDQIPNERWAADDFVWEVEYEELWRKYWNGIENDPRAISASKFFSYYMDVHNSFQREAHEQGKRVYKIQKYKMFKCYEWQSRRGNVDILYNPFEGSCYVRCTEYDYTCWSIHGRTAVLFSNSAFSKAKDEWGWVQLSFADLQIFNQISEVSNSIRAEKLYQTAKLVNTFMDKNCTGAWFIYARTYATHNIPVSWVFEKKSDAMLVKLRW